MHWCGDNGIITQATTATIGAKIAAYKEELEGATLENENISASGIRIKEYIKSMDDADINDYIILKSQLIYTGKDDTTIKAANIANVQTLATGTSNSVEELRAIVNTVINLGTNYNVPANDSVLSTVVEGESDSDHIHNSENGLIGKRLYSKNGLNADRWDIVDEYDSNNNKTARYESGTYLLKAGETYVISGEEIEFENNYIMDYRANDFIVLSSRAINWNINSTVAVQGAALNIDPTNLADGVWINNSTGLTEQQEQNAANDIDDDETRIATLNELKTHFYNFYVNNNETLLDSGIQKTGDVIYNSTNKSLAFNMDEVNNKEGEGGYLKLLKSGLDFTDGFTFEIYANLDRILYKEDSPGHWLGSGLFCRIPYLGYSFKGAMRFGYTIENGNQHYIAKVYGPPSNLSSSYYRGDYGVTTNHGSFDPPVDDPGYSVGEDFYLTCTYIVYDSSVESEKFDAYMEETNDDKIEYYIDGKLLYYTYYPKDWYQGGLNNWNKDDAPFFVGVCPWYQNTRLYYLKGEVYTTRLYQQSMTFDEVKANYETTLKYRSSFND